jgi:glutaredoxin 2
MASCAAVRWILSSLKNGPDDATVLQAFDEQAETVLIGSQQLDHISPASPEDEQLPAERVIVQHNLNAGGQPVEAVAHTGYPGNQPDTGTGRE